MSRTAQFNATTGEWEYVELIPIMRKNGEVMRKIKRTAIPEGRMATDVNGKMLNYDTYEHEYYDESKHTIYEDSNGMIFLKNRLSSIDRIMTEFAEKMNVRDDVAMKLAWKVNSNRPTREVVHNEPDFWLGVALGAYNNSVIDKTEFTDILLALQASGAKSDYFNQIVQKIGRGEL